MSNKTKNLATRLPEFDILRSLAIIGVIIIHITSTLELYAHNGICMYYVFAIIHLAQRFCVPVFLIISGFFLSCKTDNTQNPTLVLKRRLSRIIPPYIIWSLVFEFLHIVLDKKPFHLFSIIQDLLTGSADSAYYFIILIIQFYFLWWILTKIGVLQYKRLLFVSIIIQLAITFYFYFRLFVLQDYHCIDSMYSLVLAWSFYFVFGLFLGQNYEAAKIVLEKLKKPLIIITILLLVCSIGEFNVIYGWEFIKNIQIGALVDPTKLPIAESYWRISSQLYSVAFCLLIISFHKISIKTKAAKIFNTLAEWSFAIYLIHEPIVWKIMFKVFSLFGTGTLASFFTILAIDLGICCSLVYLGCKFLPKKYTRLLFGL